MSVASFARSSHETVLSRLYRDHFDVLRRYLTRKLNCPDAARDAAQDVFLHLLARPPLAPIENPRGFLLRAARNLAIDLHRTSGRAPALLPIEDHHDTLADLAADPARIAEARQRLRMLASGIQALPPKCRSVFFLHRFEGLTQNEIANQLGISAKMVEKHLARAMLHLRRLWAD